MVYILLAMTVGTVLLIGIAASVIGSNFRYVSKKTVKTKKNNIKCCSVDRCPELCN